MGFFCSRAVFEVAGDAVIRFGLKGNSPIFVLFGVATIGSYGLIVNSWTAQRPSRRRNGIPGNGAGAYTRTGTAALGCTLLLRDRRRAEARGRALVLAQAVLAPRGWWRLEVWPKFRRQLPQWTIPQVEYWQERALAANAKEQQVRLELEKMVNKVLPVEVGALSWMVLEQELRGWDRFQNRREALGNRPQNADTR